MDYDTFLNHAGEFGKYQRYLYVMVSITGIFLAFNTMGFVFIAGVPNHWCKAPEIFQNLSIEEQKALTIPKDADGQYSKCKIYSFTGILNNINVTELTVNDTMNLPVDTCFNWDYDDTDFSKTIVTQWNLVCKQQWIQATAGSTIGVGKLIGSLVFGALSDKFGRRKMIIACTCLQCIFGVASSFVPEPVSFLIFTLLLSTVSMGAFQSAFVYAIELVGVQKRVLVGSLIQCFWTIGYLLYAGIAYFLRDWQGLLLVSYVPLVLYIPVLIWLVPESPRWLLRQNRGEEANVTLKKMAKINGVSWDENKMAEINNVESEVSNVTINALSKSDYIVVYTLVSMFIWFSVNLVYYGLSYNTSNLGGSPYLNFVIAGAIEFPAYAFMWFLLDRKIGRRGSMVMLFVIAAITLLVTVPVPSELNLLTVILATAGKFLITTAFGIVFVFTPEYYPTSYRNTGLGLNATFSRLGIIIAPYMAMLGSISSPEVPLVIFGVTSLAAGLATTLLPETRGVPLPDTLDDMNHLYQNKLSCCRSLEPMDDNLEDAADEKYERDILLDNANYYNDKSACKLTASADTSNNE